MAAVEASLHRAPLAAGLRHRVDLGDIDDGSGAVSRVLALVEDVELVAGLGADLLRIATQEQAAVGGIADPELGADDEVLVLLLIAFRAAALQDRPQRKGRKSRCCQTPTATKPPT